MNTGQRPTPQKEENSADFNDFLEYYTYVSALYDNDLDFDRMITGTWNVGSNANPASIPYAGVPQTVTRVNTKERWLNDHHRAIIHGKEYDPVNPHASSYQVPYNPPKPVSDPLLMRPAGRLTLQDYEISQNADDYAEEVYNYNKQPAHDQYYKPEQASSRPQYTEASPPEKMYGARKDYGAYESPQKPKETNFPAEHRDDDVVSQHSHHSTHSVHSHHSGYSHHSGRSHQSHQSHASQYSNRGYAQPGEGYQNKGYSEKPDFYNPKQPTDYKPHKASRYY